MADFVSDLAAKAGVSEEMAKKGLATILSSLQGMLSKANFAKVQSSIPGAKGIMTESEPETAAAPTPGGAGFLAMIIALLAKLFAGVKPMEVFAKLQSLGFSTEQITKFITTLLSHLKTNMPANVLSKITNQLTPAGEAAKP